LIAADAHTISGFARDAIDYLSFRASEISLYSYTKIADCLSIKTTTQSLSFMLTQ